MRCEQKVRIPLESKQWNRPSSRDEVENTGLLSSCGGKLRIPLKWWWIFEAPLGLHKCSQALFSTFERECGIALETLEGKRASSRIEGGISWFGWRCSRKLGVVLKL